MYPIRGDRAGDFPISIAALGANHTGVDRAATITFSCNGELLIVTFTQKGTTQSGEPPKTDLLATLTTQKTQVGLTLIGTGEAVVDWGDGQIQVVKLLSPPAPTPNATHTYSSTAEHTITVSRLLPVNMVSEIYCYDNELTGLEIAANTELRSLECLNNRLEELDLSKCPELEFLDCGRNELTELNVRSNPRIRTLNCEFNQLTHFDISRNTSLSLLTCRGNRLTALDLSNNPNTKSIDCGWNLMNAAALDYLFQTLPDVSPDRAGIHISNNPGTESCDGSIAEAKGWRVSYSWGY